MENSFGPVLSEACTVVRDIDPILPFQRSEGIHPLHVLVQRALASIDYKAVWFCGIYESHPMA